MTVAVPARRDAQRNRSALVAAAQAVLARDPHASIDAIARSAGLSRRAVYGHFADREALIHELILSGAERFNVLAGEVSADTSAPLALARLTARLWDEAAEVQVAAALALDDAHVAHTAASLAPLRRRVVNIVRAGQDAGELRTDIAPPTLARLIEEAARTVITRLDATSVLARSLAVRTVLSIAGLSWRESVELLDAHPELVSA